MRSQCVDNDSKSGDVVVDLVDSPEKGEIDIAIDGAGPVSKLLSSGSDNSGSSMNRYDESAGNYYPEPGSPSDDIESYRAMEMENAITASDSGKDSGKVGDIDQGAMGGSKLAPEDAGAVVESQALDTEDDEQGGMESNMDGSPAAKAKKPRKPRVVAVSKKTKNVLVQEYIDTANEIEARNYADFRKFMETLKNAKADLEKSISEFTAIEKIPGTDAARQRILLIKKRRQHEDRVKELTDDKERYDNVILSSTVYKLSKSALNRTYDPRQIENLIADLPKYRFAPLPRGDGGPGT
jgi:hypothetical protein